MPTYRPLPPVFYQQPTTSVAKQLLGKGLLIKAGEETLLAMIVETEAYLDKTDPASHSFAGPTPRNQMMFEEGGTCYVYLSYGIHYCVNVVTDRKSRGTAVLIRAAEPIKGIPTMAKNRGAQETFNKDNPKVARKLLSGPGKLTQALGIDLSFNGTKFWGNLIQIVDLGRELSPKEIVRSPRVGISKATDLMLRFSIRDSPWVSRAIPNA